MRGKPWTQEETDYLKLHYADEASYKIAEHIGRDIRSVYAKANILGLTKSETFYNTNECGRINVLTEKGEKYRFKKGLIPKNKGKKQSEYMSAEQIEKCKKAWFKEGSLPHNTKKDGEITLRNNRKYGLSYFIRIKKGVWIPLSHKNYIDKYGPIPKGYIIRFKDGDQLNCEPENLECISKKENVIRNSIHNYPAELKPIIKLNAKLKRIIKEKEYENNNKS